MNTVYIKRAAVIGLAAVLLIACISCSMKNRKKQEDKPAESTTETEVKQKNPDYVKKGVKLPKDFGNMIYPIEAILIQSYVKELPYYTPDSDEDEADFSHEILIFCHSRILRLFWLFGSL